MEKKRKTPANRQDSGFPASASAFNIEFALG